MNKKFTSREILFLPKIFLIALIGTIILVAFDYESRDFYQGIRFDESREEVEEIVRGRILDYYTSFDTYFLTFIKLFLFALFVRLFYVAYMWERDNKN